MTFPTGRIDPDRPFCQGQQRPWRTGRPAWAVLAPGSATNAVLAIASGVLAAGRPATRSPGWRLILEAPAHRRVRAVDPAVAFRRKFDLRRASPLASRSRAAAMRPGWRGSLIGAPAGCWQSIWRLIGLTEAGIQIA
jgi:hypothetical protein